MTKTTADFRREAQEAEKHLAWGRAIDLWQAAIDSYPQPKGSLAKADLARMESRQDACKRMYFPA